MQNKAKCVKRKKVKGNGELKRNVKCLNYILRQLSRVCRRASVFFRSEEWYSNCETFSEILFLLERTSEFLLNIPQFSRAPLILSQLKLHRNSKPSRNLNIKYSRSGSKTTCQLAELFLHATLPNTRREETINRELEGDLYTPVLEPFV